MNEAAGSVSVELVVVGASWGGMEAVGRLLAGIGPECRLPIAIALHRGVDNLAGAMLSYCQGRSALPVVEVEDKDEIRPARVYVAPADYHLLVEPGAFALSVDAPVRYSRPSIDVLFESAADAYRDRLVGVILTGANEDGSRGLRRVKQLGGRALVQDPATAERREMPEAALAGTAVDAVLTVEAIATLLDRLGGRRARSG